MQRLQPTFHFSLRNVGSTRQLMSGPPALTALQLSISPALISAFTEASTILRRALQQVGAVPHCRPAPKKYRGAALDSAGNSSAPHTSRRSGQDRDKLAHLAEAIDKGFPSADERGDELGADIHQAVRFLSHFGPALINEMATRADSNTQPVHRPLK